MDRIDLIRGNFDGLRLDSRIQELVSMVLRFYLWNIGNWEEDTCTAKSPGSAVKEAYLPSMSQADIWPTALFTKSFTGRKQGLSSPNSMPLHTCVRTREIWARFFLDSTLMVEETMSNVSGVLGEIVHNNRRGSNSRGLHDGRVDSPVVEQPTET